MANQKGGVGKTTTAINLATALAAVERRVLVFDLDPQGNASTGLGIDRDQARDRLVPGADRRGARAPRRRSPPASRGSTSCRPRVDLSGAELELVDLERREYRLREAFETLPDIYDYVLIDCPPALGLLTLNAMVAADAVVVPLQCEFLALEGLSPADPHHRAGAARPQPAA